MKTIIETKKSFIMLFIVVAAVVAIFFAFPTVSDDVMSFFGVATAEACCGGSGGDGGGDGGDGPGVDDCPAGATGNFPNCFPSYSQGSYGTPASCDDFTIDPDTLPYGGGSVTLEWETTNATAVSINNGIGSVSDDGSTTVNVTDTTTFTLTAQGTGGNDTCTVTITVEEPEAPSCDSFTASPTSFTNGTGGTVTLTWATTNADTVTIDNGVGTVSEDGSTTVNVTGTITYTLTVSNANGSNTCDVTITVTDEPVPSCDSFTASPTSFTNGTGGTVTLTWATTNADTVTIDNGVGTVSEDGSTTVNVTDTITYTLTVSNTYGSDDCTVTITVEDEPNGDLRCDSFKASDTNVRENARVTLTWETTGATTASISPEPGSVPVDGSTNVVVERDTTYVLTISDGNTTKTCEVSIDTESGGGGGGGGSSSPRCDLDISDDKVKAGEKVTLSWETSRTNEIEIEDDDGKTIFESDDDDFLDGEIDVIVYKDTEFTLTAERGSRDRKCKVEVEVEEDVVEVFEKRDQPLVISLTEVPHTGFEAGPALTALFYTLLAFWGLFVAYLFVIRRDSIFGYALPVKTETAVAEQEAEFRKKVQELAARASHQNWF